MRIEGIDEDIRARLRKTLAKFPHIEEIRVTEGLLGRLLQHRLSGVYKLVLNICRLIWDSTLPCKDKDGRLEFLDFTEDEFRMNCIFERFLMNFCKLNCRDEYPEVHREYIDFQLSPFGMMFKEAGEALPMMETDVTLFNPNTQEKLILHDYHGRGTYMLTLVVEGRMPLLGKLWGRVDARPGDGDAPKVMLSELGIAIAKEEIPKIHKYYPQVEVWRVCIMPDHIHLIVRVKEDLRGGQAMESLGTEA